MKVLGFLGRTLLVFVLLLALMQLVAITATASGNGFINPPPPLTLDELFAQLAKLTGVSALVSVIIDALKSKGVITDGWAPTWSLGFNLLCLIALFVGHIVGFGNWAQVDQIAATLAQIGLFVLSLLAQLFLSKATHAAVKGIPVIGYSYSLEKKTSPA